MKENQGENTEDAGDARVFLSAYAVKTFDSKENHEVLPA